MACSTLPRMFATLTQLWLSQKAEITTATTHSLQMLLTDAVAPACATSQLAQQHNTKLSKCFNSIESGLSYQYHNVWHQVLHVIKVMFDVSCCDTSEGLTQ